MVLWQSLLPADFTEAIYLKRQFDLIWSCVTTTYKASFDSMSNKEAHCYNNSLHSSHLYQKYSNTTAGNQNIPLKVHVVMQFIFLPKHVFIMGVLKLYLFCDYFWYKFVIIIDPHRKFFSMAFVAKFIAC